MASPPVVVYRYNASPYARKVDYLLALKNIPHHTVKVNFILPRPELSDLLGISYRRIPVLAIGNDVYCDTSLIASALERRFPPSKGYGTIFPPRTDGKTDTGIIKAFSRYYPDKTLFPLAVSLMQMENFPPSFIKDRSNFFGISVDPQAMSERQPTTISVLSSHLCLINEQLADGRTWLFDTIIPSFADVSIYFIVSWSHTLADSIFDREKHSHVLNWMERMAKVLEEKKTLVLSNRITGAEAAKLIASSPCESSHVVGFDVVEANRLGVSVGSPVKIAPNDTGKSFPTLGKLVGLNSEEFVIETKGSAAVVHCHFPRLGFSIENARGEKSKL